MKRKEAIQWLQTALTSPLIYGEYADAIDMAIEALSADVVSREQYQEVEAIAHKCDYALADIYIRFVEEEQRAQEKEGAWLKEPVVWKKAVAIIKEYL